jgi:hypothetical protein
MPFNARPSDHPWLTRYVLPALTLLALAAHPVLAAKISPASVDPLLGTIESFEVKAGQTLFEPREALANPQILEHIRTLLDNGTVLPTASPAQASIQVTCDGPYCLTITASVTANVKGAKPLWQFKQRTFWFLDVPKKPTTMAKAIINQLESNYQAIGNKAP